MNRKIMTLSFLRENGDSGKVLLGMKKRGFGAGRWNGFGGKLQPGEAIEDAAKREFLEESGVEISGLEKRAIIEFSWVAKPGEILEVHVFFIREWSGVPAESEEMKPGWFEVSDIPFSEMWPDDPHWLPLFLQGKKLRAKFIFGENDVVLEKEVKEVPAL